jgi:hypothetical protein
MRMYLEFRATLEVDDTVVYENGDCSMIYFTNESAGIYRTSLKVYNTPLVVVAALQALWGDWNSTTPDLPGWNSTQPFPCTSLSSSNSTIPSWRGVLCVRRCNDSLCSLDIIGM